MLPKLNADRRAWLSQAIRTVYGDHPWLAKLIAHDPAVDG